MLFDLSKLLFLNTKLNSVNFGHTPIAPASIRNVHNTISHTNIQTAESIRNGSSAKLTNTLSPNIFESLIPTTSTTSVTDVISPVPEISFSPQDRDSITTKMTLSRSIEELRTSESQYLSDLKTLNRDYFQKLIEDVKIEVPVPIKIVHNILTKLIEYHDRMSRLFAKISDRDLCSMCSQYCRIISDNGINVFLYKWYCSQVIFHDFSQFTKLPTRANWRQMIVPTVDSWCKGWQNFFECQQPPRNKKDFSLMSLLQRPIDRITKYRLFMESILKNFVRLGYDTDEIQQSLNIVLAQLSKINRNLENGFNKGDLNGLIDFNDLKFQNYQLGCQFFGIPYFIGSCWLIYVEHKTPKCQNVPIILFKSHILLLEYHFSKQQKFGVKFVIPVTKCHLDSNSQTSTHGLHTRYSYCLKLQFQIHSSKYEVLLCWVTKSDYDNWLDALTVIIEFVNGTDDARSASVDMIEYLYRIPEKLSPYDVQTNSPNFWKQKENCYFSDCYMIKVEMDRATVKLSDHPTGSSSQSNLYAFQKYYSNSYIITLKLRELFLNERYFRNLFSDGLRIYSNENTKFDFFLKLANKNKSYR